MVLKILLIVASIAILFIIIGMIGGLIDVNKMIENEKDNNEKTKQFKNRRGQVKIFVQFIEFVLIMILYVIVKFY